MTVDHYYINTEVQVTAKFRRDKELYAPASVVAEVYAPGHGGTPTETVTYPTPSADYKWSNPATGVYVLTIENPNVAGTWTVVFSDPTDGERVKDRHRFVIEDVV